MFLDGLGKGVDGRYRQRRHSEVDLFYSLEWLFASLIDESPVWAVERFAGRTSMYMNESAKDNCHYA